MIFRKAPFKLKGHVADGFENVTKVLESFYERGYDRQS